MGLSNYLQTNTSDLAHLCIAFANLNEEETTAVKRCINGYAKQDTLLGVVLQKIYLWVEAYKSSYSQSDWQKAQKALEDKTFRVIPTFTRKWIGEKAIHSTSDKALKGLVKLNETKTKLPNQAAPFIAKQCNVDVVAHTFINVAQKLIKNAPALYETVRSLKTTNSPMQAMAQKTTQDFAKLMQPKKITSK